MHLSQLFNYPIKSCGANSLQTAEATLRGLAFDREWMLADDTGNFITGRKFPQMVQLHVEPTATGICITAPDMEPLEVHRQAYTMVRPTGVWKYEFDAYWGDGQADDWFSFFLGIEARLLYIGEQSNRQLRIDPSIRFSFADGYPYLLIGEGSLNDLNSRLAHPVSIRNFRPNLVIAGCDPFAEDGWKRIRIGDVEFEHIKSCERCIFTTIDPDSGNMSDDRQPLATLAEYRRTDAGIIFGQNLVARTTGTLRVGDEVVVLA
ncbi:MOSC domain-containing protein [Chitinivorax sp. B]|uniref:MOSC domain-containing protein n=1 Tax=Chitinivorax sp. B TaxID=2502235 RepID=UPI0010F9C0E5|nr:MOSC domain-containing protein [Chitinivorax sp. B]